MRLQNPEAGIADCPVVAQVMDSPPSPSASIATLSAAVHPHRQLSWLLRYDSSKDVRAAALGALHVTAETLGQVVSHARDVCAEVRE